MMSMVIIMIRIIVILCIDSGAPWLTKFGKLSIRENLVMT